ncbi:MAG: type II toxin-antitoxin system YafQ family toxin [Gammaproteobacteria bacterium]|nr:type II toxin-antitoxin system YafQ family toxin [Gammaproteobacteria bacterium]
MRTIERSTAFKRDFKKHGDINIALIEVLYKLISNEDLPGKYRDHSLSGDWSGYRECHVKPDLLLIYSKPDEDTLLLVRLGSHSELFG